MRVSDEVVVRVEQRDPAEPALKQLQRARHGRAIIARKSYSRVVRAAPASGKLESFV
jgi:hypothetical protein